MREVQVYALDSDGRAIELEPMIVAMLRLVVKSRERILAHREGMVELHFSSAKASVDAKLKQHIGREKG